ncbi:MAG: hypothetical protein K0U57_12945 [Alphaproteobacteria bacterium]|nr:hypothetical protein [Alphaproteobacteria bacterium]
MERVPLLVDEEITIMESIAILEY